MTWTSTPPDAPGRYWWRAPDKYGRPEGRQYGLILVVWVHHMKDYAPDLNIVTLCSFNSTFGGELSDGQGWSYGSGYKPKEFEKHYPGVEFWSEPERGPEGFLPELPSKPDWTPPDPKEIEAKRKKVAADVAAEAAKRAKEDVDERAEKIAEAKKAGETLYTCESCDELRSEDDLVQVRECPHCGDERFNGTDEGQNCPSCNRRFTRNITEHGCPDCLEECEALPETEPQPEPVAPKKRMKRRVR